MINSETIFLLILFVVNISADNDVETRIKRNVIHGPIKLINEPACREIQNLCSNLPGDADDLIVLECVQTFLTSQIESLSDECQHSIWSHTSEVNKNRINEFDNSCFEQVSIVIGVIYISFMYGSKNFVQFV